jgi:hypothetical protein
MIDAPPLEAVPATAPPRTVTVQLPVGYTDAQGKTHRQAAVRKLRGSDEALLYDASMSGAELVTRLLHSCVTSLGPFATIEPALIEHLTSADRNYLLFELRRITFGNAWNAVYTCPACETTVRRTEDLSTFAIRRLADGETLRDVTVELEDGYEDRSGMTHRTIVARLPRGGDETFVARFADLDLMQARDALLVRCIKQFGSLSRAALEGYGAQILRELTLGDRQRLQHAFSDATPGVEFERPVQCPECGLEFTAVADVTDFFVGS